MSLIIDDPEIERLVAEIAAATGASAPEALRRTLRERKEKLRAASLEERARRFREGMERDVWSKLPADSLGKPIPQEEQDEILGYGPDGYCTPSGDFSKTGIKIA